VAVALARLVQKQDRRKEYGIIGPCSAAAGRELGRSSLTSSTDWRPPALPRPSQSERPVRPPSQPVCGAHVFLQSFCSHGRQLPYAPCDRCHDEP
jgi:hypothetical protein